MDCNRHNQRLIHWMAQRGVEISLDELSANPGDDSYGNTQGKIGRVVTEEFDYDFEKIADFMGRLAE